MSPLDADVIGSIIINNGHLRYAEKIASSNHIRCPFFFKEKFFDCRLFLLSSNAETNLNHSFDVSIRFLDREFAAFGIVEGDEFKLWDRGFFANGTIIHVSESWRNRS